ncbi:MAG: 4-(cytidine 5'-diphospho)-2-C-methyl-D-erythritol kinase [Alphaproteobacteria bacterium]|nr:4-(cytidine 5'-diphospho)-2-C-methyl-D-erythritol kinase [Alphaproteobacteria bacterium]MDX5368819.1 4-(cytidine 5'-diphospho)-2-C-methyl-D-erythritol kinase [Alphaproteobacteria bacterium]MDX5463547.1 4-(cytidine 5'-diphospho)-2-C-methyl-D-erythritol kinase [Alphaproteobacteria bacterium]
MVRAARAKVNLALHVTGRRGDGYHLLDSLVVFADGVADRLTVTASEMDGFAVTGPRAQSVPQGTGNLVLRARDAVRAWARGAGHAAGPVAIVLDKHLPAEAGIGGGSADAAAAMDALAEVWGLDRAALGRSGIALTLGADVPVCLGGGPARMRGVGEVLDPVALPGGLWLALANPGVAVPTGPVFKALASADNPPLPAIPGGGWDAAEAFLAWLAQTRNDLEGPASALAPEIGETHAAMAAQPGCRCARMSGSGATVFGLFLAESAARAAAEALQARFGARGWAAAGAVGA